MLAWIQPPRSARNLVGALCAVAAAFPVWGGEPVPVEERLRRLEQRVEQLEKENGDLRSQLAKPAAAAPVVLPGGPETKLVLGGFLHAQAEFGHAPDTRWNGIKDRFYFRRARIAASGTFAEAFDFKAEIDLQGNTLGAGTGMLARANEIYLGWRRYDFATVRFGQLKPAYGAEALATDFKIPTIERSLSSDRLADGRQLGMSVGGDLAGKRVGYLVVVGNGNGANASGNDNSKFQKSARLTVTPVATNQDKLALGIDGLWADDTGVGRSDLGLTGNVFTGRRSMAGVDADWTHGPVELTGEVLRGTFRPVNAVPAARFEAQGWQVTGTWFFVPDTLQAVVQRSEFDPNTEKAGNTFSAWLLGLNYFIKGDSLKLSVDYLDGQVPGSTTPTGRILTRMQVIF